MEIYDEEAFDILQWLVRDKYGPPQNLFDHGKIYRGDMPLSNSTTNATITFFKSTSRVRIQSPGYALWLSKELPKFAEKVMNSLQRRTTHTSTPCIQVNAGSTRSQYGHQFSAISSNKPDRQHVQSSSKDSESSWRKGKIRNGKPDASWTNTWADVRGS